MKTAKCAQYCAKFGYDHIQSSHLDFNIHHQSGEVISRVSCVYKSNPYACCTLQASSRMLVILHHSLRDLTARAKLHTCYSIHGRRKGDLVSMPTVFIHIWPLLPGTETHLNPDTQSPLDETIENI